MLAGTRFRNAESQSDFLRLVVERALLGKKTTGKIVAKTLFEYKEEINVRVTAKNLRKTLKEYYSQEGLADLVVISLPEPPKERSVKLPEGEAYTPRFSYNSRHALSEAIRLGDYHLVRATHADLGYAIEYFSRALEIAPGNIRAAIGIAEALCYSLGWIGNRISANEIDDIVQRVADILDNVEQEGRGYWRFHAAAGMFLVVINQLEEAKVRFDHALVLDRPLTEAYPAYLGFLVATGKLAEAVHLAQRYLDLNIDNVGAYATCAMTMAMAGEIPEAEGVIKRGLKLDKGHPSIRMLSAAFKLAEAPALEAQEFSQLATILDGASYSLLRSELLARGGLLPDPES